MENIKTHRNINNLQMTLGSYFGVIANKQTYLNLVYLLARSACCLIDLLMLGITGSLAIVLIAVPLWISTWLAFDQGSTLKLTSLVIGSLLAIPFTALMSYPITMLEQKMASWILKVHFRVTPFWSSRASFQAGVGRYVFSNLAWKRVLFILLRVPLGFLSFLVTMIVLPLTIILFTTPVVYLTGFHDMILWELRVNSFMESMAISLLAMPLVPLVLHISNLLSRFSVWLARELLPG